MGLLGTIKESLVTVVLQGRYRSASSTHMRLVVCHLVDLHAQFKRVNPQNPTRLRIGATRGWALKPPALAL